MSVEPETEPVSAPTPEFASSDVVDGDGDNTLMNMRIPDLIYVLRIATHRKQYDDVERVLVAREALLKHEVEKLREILDCERLDRMKMEDDLKNCNEKYEKAKIAEDLYEKLLGAVKKNGLRDEEEDATIDELRSKNRGLEDELERWKKKFVELNERVLRLEHDTELLMSGIGDDFRVPIEVKEEKENYGGNNADSTCSRRNEDTTNRNKDELGASSAGGKLGLRTIIEIESGDDDDDDGDCTTQEALMQREVNYPSKSEAAQKKNKDANGMSKRKFGSRDPPNQFPKKGLNGVDIGFTSTSSSDSTELDMDQLRSYRGSVRAIDKRRKI